MVGALKEDHLRCLLTESGETRRWKEAERETPEGFEVLYPPPPLDADALRRLAESATRMEQLEDASSSLEEPECSGEKTFSPPEGLSSGENWWLSPLKLALMVWAPGFRRPLPLPACFYFTGFSP